MTSLGVVSDAYVSPGLWSDLGLVGVSRGRKGRVNMVIREATRPLTELLVVPNGVAGSETNPLRDRAVLLLRLGELLLRPERLVAL